MEERILFNSKKVRKLFFEKILKSNKLNKWSNFIIKFDISRKTLDSYKNGKLTLPNSFYEKVTLNFDKEMILFFKKNITFLNKNWGRIKGGISTYSKHREIFDEGRKKAMMMKRNRIPKFNINLPLTEELAYFIGLFIGDGFTNKYGRYYILQFTGDKRKETSYYSDIISKLTLNLFNLTPHIREEQKTNALRVNFYSIDLFKLITERFKIKAGRKSKDVLIPEEILNSDKEILFSCIAGLYDAEGCFYFDNRKSYKIPYPAIALHMNNPQLIQQISSIFLRNNLKHSYTSNYSTLYIYGKKDITLFLSKIKLLNPKYTTKIEMLRKI